MSSRRWFAVICGLAMLMRLSVFFFPFVNIDENEYAVAARILLDGGLPYRDFLVYQPPVIYYFYAATFWLFRTTAMWAPHLGILAVVLLTCRVLWAIGRQLGDDRIGVWSAACYAVFPTLIAPSDMLGANCEIVLVLPLCWALWCVFRAELSPHPLRYLCAAGACLGIAFLTKYPAGIFLVPFGLHCLSLRAPQRGAWQSSVRTGLPRSFGARSDTFGVTSSLALLAMTTGWLVVVGASLVILAALGVWPETLEAFRYIVLYAKGPAQNDFVYILLKFLFRTLVLAFTGALMWWSALQTTASLVAGRWSLVKTTHNARHPVPYRNWLFLIWCCATGFIAVLIGGRLYGHYYYLVFPFLALLAGGTLAGVIGIGWEHKRSAVRYRWAAWSMLCITLALGYNSWRYVASGNLRSADWEPVLVALARHHRPDATLFVWGYCPQLYTLAYLRPATRFVTADYLTGRMPKSAGLEYDPAMAHPPSSWEKFLNDFRDGSDVVVYDTASDIFPRAWEYLRADFLRRAPDIIVDTARSNYRRYGRYPIKNFPFLQSTMDQSYTRVDSVNGYDIYLHKQ